MSAVYKALTKAKDKKNSQDDAGKSSSGLSELRKKNRQRVLILSSRGITYRHRHLMNNLATMMPHSRKDVKFDSKSKLAELNELAELYNCNNVMFFEARKGQDLYMWLSKAPNGPTIKFHVQNVHTMEELQFLGNSLRGSRPILSFDAAFDTEPHLRLMKEMFQHTFGVPQGTRGSKPFIDHILVFSVIDGKVWFRNYQIIEGVAAKAASKAAAAAAAAAAGGDDKEAAAAAEAPSAEDSLVEIGPRFVLQPIVIQEGSFGGPIIYQNSRFVSPNHVRSELRKKKAERRNVRAEQQENLVAKRDSLGLRTNSEKKAVRNGFDAKALFA